MSGATSSASPDTASEASTPASLVAAGIHIGPVAEATQSCPVGHSGLQADRHVPDTQVNPDLHAGWHCGVAPEDEQARSNATTHKPTRRIGLNSVPPLRPR